MCVQYPVHIAKSTRVVVCAVHYGNTKVHICVSVQYTLHIGKSTCVYVVHCAHTKVLYDKMVLNLYATVYTLV